MDASAARVVENVMELSGISVCQVSSHSELDAYAYT